jgi:hypothetical protein
VALNLQSERAKNELVQLVDTMVAYSVTYRNTKFEPQERANGSIVPTDIPSLSLDPPISDIISFKVLSQSFYWFILHFFSFLTVLDKAVDFRATNPSTLVSLWP